MTTSTVVDPRGYLDGTNASAVRLSTAVAELRTAIGQAHVTTGRACEAALEDEQAHKRADAAWRAARAAGWTEAELHAQGCTPMSAVSWERHPALRHGPRPGAG